MKIVRWRRISAQNKTLGFCLFVRANDRMIRTTESYTFLRVMVDLGEKKNVELDSEKLLKRVLFVITFFFFFFPVFTNVRKVRFQQNCVAHAWRFSPPAVPREGYTGANREVGCPKTRVLLPTRGNRTANARPNDQLSVHPKCIVVRECFFLFIYFFLSFASRIIRRDRANHRRLHRC